MDAAALKNLLADNNLSVQLEATAQRILPLIDLTSLNDDDSDTDIIRLCQQAKTPCGNVAAICIYPHFVSLARKQLTDSAIKIATVANFPSGQGSIPQVIDIIQQAIYDGADEVDVVIPYHDFLSGKLRSTVDLLQACRNACGTATVLKVILESGILQDPQIIANVSQAALAAGADFLKTSTGKVPVNATLEAAAVMLLTIQSQGLSTAQASAGFKASGGIRTVTQAAAYLRLADHIMGADWVSPQHFRFGASALLQDVVNTLTHQTTLTSNPSY